MKTQSLFKILLILPGIYLLSCASPYHLIEPQKLVYHEALDTLIDEEIEISYRYKVLEAKENKRYEKIARRNGISLIAMRIANYSTDTLHFPEDILIKSAAVNHYPLEMEEAIDRTLQFNELAMDYVGTDDPWIFLGMVGVDLITMSVESKANKRFIKEMEDYYLVYSSIAPGDVVSGLIALPVRQHAPLFFEKRN